MWIVAPILAFVLAAPPAEKVTVFVASAADDSGFTDPSKGNRDTIKDLKDSLKGQKELKVVDSADEATIVLTVLREGKPVEVKITLK